MLTAGHVRRFPMEILLAISTLAHRQGAVPRVGSTLVDQLPLQYLP
jgi:hypothetical protein